MSLSFIFAMIYAIVGILFTILIVEYARIGYEIKFRKQLEEDSTMLDKKSK